MSLKSYFDIEMRTTVIFAILGIVVGYLSFLLNNSAAAFIIMAVAGAVFQKILKKILKINENFRWWLGNGFVIYIFLWLVAWTIFYNVAIR